ncbi:MAG: four helix bundle protein [Parcubacteria group bacterium]
MPLVHDVSELYKYIYGLGKKIPKRDRFGLHSKIETLCLELLIKIIEAVFTTRTDKPPILNVTRINIETLKRLVRIEWELEIITAKKYEELTFRLQKISKMTSGWMKYLINRQRSS